MVRISFDPKPFRKMMLRTWGGTCVPSPSMDTKTGRKILAEDPDTPAALALLFPRRLRSACSARTRVLNHVMLHQTVIGCAGGGSNFAGIPFPFINDRMYGKDIRIVTTEPVWGAGQKIDKSNISV